ncbi:uncharacterized protein LOC108736109 [Agrilus planipennis]|uniref:Uncharacterized protein LOC108736109 n=1 Tax=Agrilus planipennis TaxID=224129 RepID=A0A1W4WV20_AGRPL|nr:uncharacterized protein LOC108736109 [Agrilus planipennis]
MTYALRGIYDEEFNRYLQLSKTLVKQIKTTKDKEICTKWISKLCTLDSKDPVVKKNRNHFFRYMLNVLKKGVQEGPEGHLGYPQYDDRAGKGWEQKTYMSRWSPDKRTYVAAKPMPGRGALIYMAVAKDPSLGWEMPQIILTPEKQKSPFDKCKR